MEHIQPIELLKQRLNEYEKALHKSFESFKAGQISGDLHCTHKGNLQPLIFKYKQAIEVLTNWTN
jgi:hypothetical protein